jgi:hypothetical protein
MAKRTSEVFVVAEQAGLDCVQDMLAHWASRPAIARKLRASIDELLASLPASCLALDGVSRTRFLFWSRVRREDFEAIRTVCPFIGKLIDDDLESGSDRLVASGALHKNLPAS